MKFTDKGKTYTVKLFRHNPIVTRGRCIIFAEIQTKSLLWPEQNRINLTHPKLTYGPRADGTHCWMNPCIDDRTGALMKTLQRKGIIKPLQYKCSRHDCELQYECGPDTRLYEIDIRHFEIWSRHVK